MVCLFVGGGWGEFHLGSGFWSPVLTSPRLGGGRWPRISMEFGGSLFFQCGFVGSAKFLVEDSHFK